MSLEENNIDFIQMVENSLSAILIMHNKEVIYANPISYELLGYEPNEILVLDRFLHPDYHSFCRKRLGHIYTYRKPVALMEQKMVKKDGAIIDVEVKASPYIFNGKVLAQVHFQDITSRKLYEQKLKNSEEKYRIISKNVTDVISEQSTKGEWLYLSPSSKEILGYDPDELLGKSPFEFIHPDDKRQAKDTFCSIVQSQTTKTIRFRFMKKSGDYIWLESRGKVLCRRDCKTVITDSRDVSEQMEAEKRLRQSEKLAIIGELSAGVVHEIRNPLTSIKGFLQLMQAGTINTTDYIQILTTEVERIEQISNDLLAFAKPSDELKPQNLVQIMHDVIFLMRGQAERKHVDIDWTPSSDSTLTILGDASQLKQVLINIVKNGIEASKDGGKLKITASKTNGHAVIEITDNGEGIPADKLAKIGQSFFTTKEKGTGLGLMVSYKIVKNHHGKITIDSKEGEGTTFRLHFPLFLKKVKEV
ncbi:PAS domain S-box protein [Terrihalobacillus insolitus]|uniref:PAS domain S-box protein n=1 Tax=Terrihalobacillus insolitus TaxID=2950438 RepID=UPI0023410E0F|nr:PAS domain S-box protein [Terrihalobacillus insolitus]MDC3415190.1 PAS domain S-box protein [Terrihalobacillus insolitus]